MCSGSHKKVKGKNRNRRYDDSDEESETETDEDSVLSSPGLSPSAIPEEVSNGYLFQVL